MNIPQDIVRLTSNSKQDNWDFASLQIQGLQDESRDGEELRLDLVEMEREDGNQLWSDDEIGAELTKVRLCDICDKTDEFYNGPITSALHQHHYT